MLFDGKMFMKLTVWPEEMAQGKILFLLEINLNDISSHSVAKMIWSEPTLRAKLYKNQSIAW